jgi:hypothetical protein
MKGALPDVEVFAIDRRTFLSMAPCIKEEDL